MYSSYQNLKRPRETASRPSSKISTNARPEPTQGNQLSDSVGGEDRKTKIEEILKVVSVGVQGLWDDSKPNTETAHEMGAVIVKRSGTYKLVNRAGEDLDKFEVVLKFKRGEINKGTDRVVGDVHTHPLQENEFLNLSTVYELEDGREFDGKGEFFSGDDFVLMVQNLMERKTFTGHVSILESGSVRYIVEVVDGKSFVEYFASAGLGEYNKIVEDQLYNPKNFNSISDVDRQKMINKLVKENPTEFAMYQSGKPRPYSQIYWDAACSYIESIAMGTHIQPSDAVRIYKTTDKEKLKISRIFPKV